MIVTIVNGDLLEATEPFIAQQCNCVTVHAHGLSESIFSKFPYANVYAQREKGKGNRTTKPSIPGTVSVHCPPSIDTGIDGLVVRSSFPTILNMMGQWAPGKALHWKRQYPSDTYKDDSKERLCFFEKCLAQLEAIVDENDHVAIPFKIGCGLAGGKWELYETMLQNAKTKFVIYKKDP